MSIQDLRRLMGVGVAVVVAIVCFSLGGASYLRWKLAGGGVNGETEMAADLEAHTEQQALERAERLREDGKTEQAIVLYREVLARRPDSVEAQLGIARGEVLAGRESDGAREFERVLELEPRHAEALLQLALIYSHERDTWPQSARSYRRYLEVEPADVEAQLGLARVLAWLRQPKEAAELFGRNEVALRMTPADERDYAFALNNLGRPSEAEPVLRKVLERAPDDLEAVHQLAAAHASRGQWGEALPLYRRVLESNPNDPSLNLAYGQGLLAVRRYEEALEPLGKAASLSPANREACLAHARALKGADRMRKASKELERVLPSYRNNPHIIREYADLMLERKRFKEAAQRYQEAERLGLRDDRLITSLAGALMARGQHQEAIPYLEAAYTRTPTTRRAMDLAKAYSKAGRKAEARTLLDRIESGAVQTARR